MKISISALFIFIAFCFLSCGKDEVRSEGLEIEGLKQQNLESLIQTFTLDLNSNNNVFSIETNAGCTFRFYPKRFENNGTEVTGEVNIDIIEIFDKGTMAITGKHTMTEDALLISGGEFYINASQGDKNIDYNGTFLADVPAYLSSSFSTEMQLFRGGEELNSSEDWVLIPNEIERVGVLAQNDSTYLLFLDGFEWFNCDRFYNSPEPTTELNILVPSEFNLQNSTVYLSIKNERSSLGIATQEEFPIGLDVHLIFVAEEDDQFLYQIISTAVSEIEEYKFERGKMKTATSEELKNIINGLD